MRNKPNRTKAAAYDQARKEFYDIRLQQDVERRVAREEALHTGAYFGKSAMEVGMELEDREYDDWREWAKKETVIAQQKQAAMYTGLDNEDVAVEADPTEELAGLEDISDSVPAQGQIALRRATVPP